VITEQDLIELGFERETTSYNDSITSNVDGYFVEKEDIAFYTLMIDELEFSSNTSDEWDDELEITITDTSIVFRNLEDLRNVIDILKRNQE
jgi:hypothetical protein|tara:strand:+ start:243 stop:515 length:273 start_codon:yes stop_codon:yes gene_type:complete